MRCGADLDTSVDVEHKALVKTCGDASAGVEDASV
jgi:hypothetical protein